MSSIDSGHRGGPSWDPRRLDEQSGTATEGDPNAPQDPNAQGAAPAKGAKGPGPAATPGISASALTAAAALGAGGVADAAPLSATPSTKLSGANTVLASPPPLPPTRGVVGPDTAANYKSLMDDVGDAMARGTPEGKFDVGAFVAQAQSHDLSTPRGQQALTNQVQKAVVGGVDHFNTMSNAGMMAAFLELNVRNQASGKELQANLLNLATMSRNNSIEQSIQEREEQAKALKKAHQKQQKLAPLMAILKVVILVVTAIATVMTAGGLTPLLAAAMAAGMGIGAVVGGSVKGAKNGKGFDWMGALDGAGYALDAIGVAALAKVILKVAVEALFKLSVTAAEKLGLKQAGAKTVDQSLKSSGSSATSVATNQSKTAAEQAKYIWQRSRETAEMRAKRKADEKVAKAQEDALNVAASQGTGKVGAAAPADTAVPAGTATIPAAAADNASWATKAMTGMRDAVAGRETDAAASMQLWAQALPTFAQISLQLGQAGINYATQKQTLDAKEHEAMAKQHTVRADASQMMWEDLQSSIQGITDNHNKAVDQSVEMINRQHRTAQKAASLGAG